MGLGTRLAEAHLRNVPRTSECEHYWSNGRRQESILNLPTHNGYCCLCCTAGGIVVGRTHMLCAMWIRHMYVGGEWWEEGWKKIIDVMSHQYHSLTKKHPPPTFGPISCIVSKFTWMSALKSTLTEFERHSLKCMHIWGKKLCVILHRRLLQCSFGCTDVANAVCTASYTMLMVPFRVLCAVGHDLEVDGGSVARHCSIICFKGIESL